MRRATAVALFLVLPCACRGPHETALGLAARRGDAPAVRQLIRSGEDVNARTTSHDGETMLTPLMEAAIAGQSETVKELLAGGADPNLPDDSPPLALGAAHPEVVRLLLAAGARTTGSPWVKPLVRAADSGSLESVRLLLAAGSDPDDVARTGTPTALIAAADDDNPLLVSLLADSGADLDLTRDDYGTALSRAARFGRPSMVRVLIEHGASRSHVDRTGRTALQVAADEGHDDIVAMLSGPGVAPPSPGRLLLGASKRGDVARMTQLLETGASPNWANEEGKTPLMAAAESSDPDAVSRLLEAGADVSATNRVGCGALGFVMPGRQGDAVRALLTRAGAASCPP